MDLTTIAATAWNVFKVLFPIVNKITYHLHETFPNPVREVFRTDANPNCKLVTWAWGKFPM